MEIKKISSQNFGQIYFDSKDIERKIRLQIEDLPQKEKRQLYKSIFHNLHSDKYDVHVNKDGSVYVRNNQTGKKTEVFGMVPLFNKFQAALGYARINEIRDEYKSN